MHKEQALKLGGLYLAGVLLLTFYGIEVCPFLESLRTIELASVLLGAFLISFIVRFFLFSLLDGNRTASIKEVGIRRPWLWLRLDLGIWIFAGLLVTAWNSLRYNFPVESGLKVVLGCMTLGIFSSTYLALDLERDLIHFLIGEGNTEELQKGRFFSITTKFMLFIGVSLAVITGVILLLVYKDFTYVIDAIAGGKPFQFSWVVNEVLFVFGILLAGCLLVAWQYSHNLNLMFDLQLRAFDAVKRGDYDTFVPVVSHDEFSLIAEGSNKMILGLREKRRIERAFGKYMSPPIAEVILENEEEARLGGRQVDVAVLFVDVRKFTSLSESHTPQETVNILNDYFTLTVKAIHQAGGILDKFIGDAAMGVFGLDNCEAPCDNALRAALEIHRGLKGLNERFNAQGWPSISAGIGIHFGPVVAGNIGSPERLEYTVIGDTVNTASRLEDLTKEISSPVAASGDVYNLLNKEMKACLTFIGDYMLRGKARSHPVYGLAEA